MAVAKCLLALAEHSHMARWSMGARLQIERNKKRVEHFAFCLSVVHIRLLHKEIPQLANVICKHLI